MLTKEQEAAVARTPDRYKAILVKAYEGKLSASKALKVKCLECSNYQIGEARECPASTCPLWASRPGTTKASKRVLSRAHVEKMQAARRASKEQD